MNENYQSKIQITGCHFSIRYSILSVASLLITRVIKSGTHYFGENLLTITVISNERQDISIHLPLDCFFEQFVQAYIKGNCKNCASFALCEENPLVTIGFARKRLVFMSWHQQHQLGFCYIHQGVKYTYCISSIYETTSVFITVMS